MSYNYDLETRKRMIAEMYVKGKPLEEIADEVGYKNTGHVRVMIKKLGLDSPKPKYGLDVPKVLALQKAGWNMDKICEEFSYHFTPKQIRSIVAEWKAANHG